MSSRKEQQDQRHGSDEDRGSESPPRPSDTSTTLPFEQVRKEDEQGAPPRILLPPHPSCPPGFGRPALPQLCHLSALLSPPSFDSTVTFLPTQSSMPYQQAPNPYAQAPSSLLGLTHPISPALTTPQMMSQSSPQPHSRPLLPRPGGAAQVNQPPQMGYYTGYHPSYSSWVASPGSIRSSVPPTAPAPKSGQPLLFQVVQVAPAAPVAPMAPTTTSSTTSSSDSIRVSAAPKKRKPRARIEGRSCSHCGTVKTSEWRMGPEGRGTLCNACGLRYRKKLKSESQRRGSTGSLIPMSLLVNAVSLDPKGTGRLRDDNDGNGNDGNHGHNERNSDEHNYEGQSKSEAQTIPDRSEQSTDRSPRSDPSPYLFP